MSDDDAREKLSFLQLLGSVLAAMFGVQSNEKRIRDFSRGKPSHFIIAGIILTALFVLTVWGVVKLVMAMAGV